MIVGITGTDGAGKGTVVDYLVTQKGFVHYSARALCAEVLATRGLPGTRENLRLVGNELRRQHGNDYIVAEYLRRAAAEGVTNCIIESIRAVAEATTLQASGGILLAVDADPRVRYERVTRRREETDNITFEAFVAHEALEMQDSDPNGMQKAAVMKMANFTLLNNGTLAQLEGQIESILEQLHYAR